MKIGFFRTNADLLFTKYLKAAISYEKMTRVETYPFPEAALRESLFNALAHKDYSSGIPVQISVYDDKIVFWNAGQLPDSWTVDRLNQKHPSVPFNPDIASAFFRAGYIESWGRGIEKINDACKAAGTPLPVFDTGFSGLMVTFKSLAVEKTVEKTVEKDNAEAILRFIKENPRISASGLQKATGLSRRGVEWNLEKLKKEKKIERIGPDRGGYWKTID